jgi:acyl-CoA carboxylase epsilon subunit-like protein
MNELDVQVRGNASEEEIAAVIAALQARRQPASAASRFEQWRRERQRAVRDNR